jgi:polysaccharide pyruvyl transferase WcaK-like protein
MEACMRRLLDMIQKMESDSHVTVTSANALLAEATAMVSSMKKTAMNMHTVVETIELVPLRDWIKKHKSISPCNRKPSVKFD